MTDRLSFTLALSLLTGRKRMLAILSAVALTILSFDHVLEKKR
jgi:hypothetical protein